MKYLKILTLAAILAPIFSYGQTDSTSAAKPDVIKPNQIAISAEKLNILYFGIDNPIEIAICDVNSENISATIDNGTITKESDVKWTVKVKNVGKVHIKVFIDKGGKKTLYAERDFRVLKMPNPVVTIGGVKSGPIEKQKIMNQPHLKTVLEDFLFDNIKYSVTSFTLTFNNGTAPKVFQCTGSKISAEALAVIQKAVPGNKIIISEIKAVGPDNLTRSLDVMNLVVK